MKINLSDHRHLVTALQQQPHFGHAVGPIEHIETHISSILLTGDYAYKIKKPVDLGFLNFSTLAKRKHYCEEELRLNGRTAPDIYLSVVTINGSIEQPQINGNGPIIEYAVKMRQFDQSGLLGNLLRQGKLNNAIIDELADVISAFHSTAAIISTDSNLGSDASVYAPMIKNIEIIRPLLDDPHEQDRLNRLQTWSDNEHKQLGLTLTQRKSNGFIRECHGDLHLDNITRINGVVTLFDGIEFNEPLHWIDVISDLAFTSMDLIDHGAATLAWRLINRYLEHSGDYAGLEVLRFYQVYRAMVRAKIACIRLDQLDLADKKRADAIQQYRDYAALAEQLTIPQKPLLILTCGLSGSGKSWLSQQLLEALPACRIRSDVERKRLFPASQANREEIDSDLYSAEATEKTYQRLLTLSRHALTSGYATIVDAAFLKKAQRLPFQTQAKSLNCPVIVLHTRADQDILKQRILRRSTESSNVSDATLEVLESQVNRFERPTNAENLIEIDTGQQVKINSVVERLRTIT
ncbi:MAG: aminoglycoside phosphotransferase [Thiothrix sp.]|nr:MAG: aminoglycoside phosphotransferase [Thiothrix sp.]